MTDEELNDFVKKIDAVLFKENCEFIRLNPKDYGDILKKIQRNRFKPEIQVPMLKVGIVGYLDGPRGEPSKTIWVDKAIESGIIHGVKVY